MMKTFLLLIILGSVSQVTSNNQIGCPGSWPQYHDACFVVVKTTESYTEAVNFCLNALHGHLVDIQNETENNFTVTQMKIHGVSEVWLGLKDNGGQVWAWTSHPDKPFAAFQNFQGDPPRGTPGSVCVKLMASNEKWKRHDCEYPRLPFVCKIPIEQGRWSDWDAKDECDKTCGGGTQLLIKTCLENSCGKTPEGKDFSVQYDRRRCNEQPCPEWSGWGQWSQCDSLCSFGNQKRTRSCSILKGSDRRASQDCPGPLVETKECYTHCPTFHDWALWHQGYQGCNFRQEWLLLPEETDPDRLSCIKDSKSTSNDGTKFMNWTRCTNYLYWRPAAVDDKTCKKLNVQWRLGDMETECAAQGECKWNDWIPWSQCSATCGGGTEQRHRTMVGHYTCRCQERERRPCAIFDCPRWSKWDPWIECTATCQQMTGVHKRFRDCQVFGDILPEESNKYCDWEVNLNCTSFEECRVQEIPCNKSASNCVVDEAEPVKGFDNLSLAGKFSVVVRYAVNSLGSLFLIGVCTFEIVAYCLIRNFTPQRMLQMFEEITLIICHFILVFMTETKANQDNTICMLSAGIMNWGFMAYFSFLALECLHVMVYKGNIIPEGTLVPLWSQLLGGVAIPVFFALLMVPIFGRDGLVMESDATDTILCWINLQIRYPARTYFCIFSILFASALTFTESSCKLREIFPTSFDNLDWKSYADAEFAFTGMYWMIFLAYLSFGSTLAAYYWAITAPESGSGLAAGTASLVFNILFGCCIFFYHSFGNAKVREMIQKMKARLSTLMSCCSSWSRGKCACDCGSSSKIIQVSPRGSIQEFFTVD